jgi:hypothetical protein
MDTTSRGCVPTSGQRYLDHKIHGKPSIIAMGQAGVSAHRTDRADRIA